MVASKANSVSVSGEPNRGMIEDILKGYSSRITNPLLPEFIKQFYAHFSREECIDAPDDTWFAIANSALTFASFRKKNEAKIRVYNPDKEHHGWESPYTVVEMVNTDMPFLVDSVTAELNRQGFKIYQILHPVIHSLRNENGELLEILPDKSQAKDSVIHESFIHFQVTGTMNQAALEALEAGLFYVLKNVSHAVEDWKPMLQAIEQLSHQ
ncbi:MAG: hypothetical protein ACK4M7_05250, partial [Burkholderiales bacterium]